MVRSVIIARVHDGLPLAASMDDDQVCTLSARLMAGPQLDSEFPDYKAKSKSILKTLSMQTEPMCSIEAGSFFFHILIAEGVGFLCITEKLYPRRLAYTYLEDLRRHFNEEYTRDRVESAARPYAFIKFDTYIQKAKRSFQDVRASENLGRLRDDLIDVTQVMQTNIKEVLERGTKLERMSLMSSTLSEQSKRYVKDARNLNWELLKRKYGPPAILLVLVVLFIYVWVRWL